MTASEATANDIRDVIIIGGGPAGLAVACFLCEPLPAASFTDTEHQRYFWLRKHTGKLSIKNRRNGSVTTAKENKNTQQTDMLVLDASGEEWMARWKRLFKTFEIPHLRSPMFFHIDPAQRDGLLSYAHMNGRGSELRELTGCVGKEQSKHRRKQLIKKGRQPKSEPTVDERDRNDYFVPSTPLFESQCTDLVDRYRLRKGLLRQEKVMDIQFDYFENLDETDKVFMVKTNCGVHFARTVVLAVGPANEVSMPITTNNEEEKAAVTHAMQIKCFPSERVKAKISDKRQSIILIVGGGLTSAQLADLAIQKRVSKVYLIMRGPMKIKHFDIDLEWVGKFRNFSQAAFWTADTHEERWELYTEARQGGSIAPYYKKIVERHVASGKLSLHDFNTLGKREWDSQTKTWKLELCGKDRNETVTGIDHIYFATGVQTDVRKLPYMQSMLSNYPIKDCGGLPCITEDMEWRKDVPLYMAGRLGALELGPGAPNLIGARIGAERISWSIRDLLERKNEKSDVKDVKDFRFNYFAGRGSQYDALAVGEAEDEAE